MQKYLKENFKYYNGNLIRIRKSRKAKIGDILGSLSNGYLIANFKKKMYNVHRLIWIYHNGNIDENLYIDHINRKRNDNRIENLRLMTFKEHARMHMLERYANKKEGVMTY